MQYFPLVCLMGDNYYQKYLTIYINLISKYSRIENIILNSNPVSILTSTPRDAAVYIRVISLFTADVYFQFSSHSLLSVATRLNRCSSHSKYTSTLGVYNNPKGVHCTTTQGVYTVQQPKGCITTLRVYTVQQQQGVQQLRA